MFLGGHGLGIHDQYVDSTDLTEWIDFARKEWALDTPPEVVIYPDTSVSQQYVKELADRIHEGLDGSVTIYQAFFLPTAEYYVTFDVLHTAAGKRSP